MAIWQTPITNWDGLTVNRKYYNFGDLDRVEQNTEYLKDEFEALGYIPSTTTFTYPRTNATIEFKDGLNRIESNIKAIKDATFTPLMWETPKINWVNVLDAFGYTEANRLEKNCLGLYTMLNNIKDSYIPVGHPLLICGKGNTRF